MKLGRTARVRDELGPGRRPRRRTVRLRLTALYGGLFIVSGAALLGITFGFVSHAIDNSPVTISFGHGKGGATVFKNSGGGVTTGGTIQAFNNHAPNLTARQAQLQARQLQLQSAAQVSAEKHDLLMGSGIALIAMAIVSIGLGWIVAGRVLRPIRTITNTARDISSTNLHRRLDMGGPNDELKELGDTFDALLERLQRSFQSQRQFVANASHELRTPLARQRTVVQVALSDPNATINSLRAAHERVLASGAQEERLIESLLMLTRGQAGLPDHVLVDLASQAELAILLFEPEAKRRDIVVHAQLEPAFLSGDSGLLERLVTNLVDNAMRYNVPGGRLEVTTGRLEGEAVLSVTNTGDPVPPGELPRLVEPFQRLANERTASSEGSGLGLSIVKAITEAHDGSLVLKSRPRGGLEVVVRFPGQDVPPKKREPEESTASGRGAGRDRTCDRGIMSPLL